MREDILVVVASEEAAAALRTLLPPNVRVSTAYSALGGRQFNKVIVATSLDSCSEVVRQRLREWHDTTLLTKLSPGGELVSSATY